MNTTVDSEGWTGLAALTEAERNGVLTFPENAARLRRHRTFAAASAVAFPLLAVWLLMRSPSEGQRNPIMVLIGVIIVSAGAIVVWHWLTKRLADAKLTAPLALHADRLQIGSSGLTVPFADIADIGPATPRSPGEWAAWMFYRPPLSFGLRPVCIYQLKLKNNTAASVLDFDVLDGDPDKIYRILDHRIQHAKT